MPDEMIKTKNELMARIRETWRPLNDLLGRLTPAQLTGPRDDAGWCAIDHLTHLAAWEDSVTVLFQGKPRHEALGIDAETLAAGDFDEINGRIRDARKGLSPAIVLGQLQAGHAALLAFLEEATDADLNRRVAEYFPQAAKADTRRVLDLVFDNTAHHYGEHLNWIQAIVDR